MEIQGTDGSKTTLKPNKTTIFGRQNLSDSTTDLTVSRRHVAFDQSQTSQRVSFEVVGKNPVWVYSNSKNDGGGKKLMTFKRFQRGELSFGDLFCVSGKKPVWFGLKVVNDVGLGQSLDLDGQLSQSLEEGDFELDFVDGSNIDPVREFGFLVIGHEFDQYPKNRIRDIKNWNWFLDDPVGGSDDDDDESEETKGKKRGGRKRKKANEDDDVDEEWSADSDGEELTAKATKVQRPKYHTRSKGTNISDNKRTKKKTSSKLSSKDEEVEEYEDEDEVDETLGGFIVDDETAEEEEAEGNEIDNDDEDEFVEDEDELEEPHNFCEDEDELDEQL